MKSKYFFILLVLSYLTKSQVIYNAYASVSNSSGASFTIATVDETNHTFVNGEQVIVMQMQDDVIGTNTLNTASFGNLSTIKSAGLWELRTIQSQTRSGGGVLQTLTFTTPLANTYNVGINSSLQVISFRRLSAGAFTSTNDITALPWNGNIGGVVAIEVVTDFTLNHSIFADGLGFRLGVVSNDDGSGCTSGVYFSNSANYGEKGEGIYKSTDPNFRYAQGKILTGGGGGVTHNGGGGGGGNFTAGGMGGPGWDGSFAGCTPSAAGDGGIDLSAFILPSRIFMGGGGGGAQQNNGLGSNGANGGGIVIVKANRLITNNTCASPIRISANGNTAPNTTGGFNDAAGGGGAAGSVVLQIPTYSISGTCPLTIQSNGGDGGSSPFGTTHAGGGAGGQGVVVFSAAQPTLNTVTSTNNGNPGCNDNSNPCTNLASAASGSNNLGIFSGINGVLPIELLNFEAQLNSKNKVDLSWGIASSKNIHSFSIERSKDGLIWETLDFNIELKSNIGVQNYTQVDYSPLKGISYYRLKIKEVNGLFTYSPTRVIELKTNLPSINIYPNPSQAYFFITSSDEISNLKYQVYDVIGKQIQLNAEVVNANQIKLSTASLAKGLYFVSIQNASNEIVFKTKLMVE